MNTHLHIPSGPIPDAVTTSSLKQGETICTFRCGKRLQRNQKDKRSLKIREEID